MPKALFFSLPSVSVSKTLTPVVEEVAKAGFEIVYYNTSDFFPAGDHPFRFIAYPSTFKGYYSDKIDGDTSYFDFGNILIDSAESLADFLIAEIEREKPDFIMHSHLAVWGKLMAAYAKIPAITLYTTFVLDKRIMFAFQRQQSRGQSAGTRHTAEAMRFYRKSAALYERLQLKEQPDLWDVYVNKGRLNLSFILDVFQPERTLFGEEFHFLGYPTFSETYGPAKRLIYVAMGTILNKDISFYTRVINVLKALEADSVVSVGPKVDIAMFGPMPRQIKIVGFTDQRALLREAKLFITRGGMASVHESVYSCTPMIVVPMIPEQQITAQKIRELGIGIDLPPSTVDEDILHKTIDEMLHNDSYRTRLECLGRQIPVHSPGKRAVDLINELLYE